jgi:tetratricopeptide (TPR) repeat protein
MKRAILLAAALWSAASGTARADDVIYVGAGDRPRFGKITGMTATAITLEVRNAGPLDIATNEVARITFESSPDSLRSAQSAIHNGDFEKALDALKNENTPDKRREVGEEIIYCRAYCAAQLAISGADDPAAAATQMLKFITDCPNNYRHFKACELLGDIYVTIGKFAEAQKYYSMLGEAPWPDYKIRAEVALGRSLLAQNKAAAAERAFEEAITNDATGELADFQRTAAGIGKARCMTLTGRNELALHNLNEIIDRMGEKTPADINAMAYNALGAACRKAGKPRDAMRAFLRVHLQYNAQPDLDAEAVANLEKLFIEDHKPKHAQDMRTLLKEKYSNSRWVSGVK